MNWFWFAFISTFLWSSVVFLDKFLIERYLKNRGVGSLILFSSLFAALVVPIIYAFHPAVGSIPHLDIFLLILSGILISAAIMLYLYALEDEDTSIVVPMFQLVPVFSYIFGVFFLGENLTGTEIFGGLVIMMGAIILSLEIEEDKKTLFKIKALTLMVFSCFLLATTDTLYKYVSVNEIFIVTQFWHYVGVFVFGVFLLLYKPYRLEFIKALTIKPAITIFNFSGEAIQVGANMIHQFALLLGPLALVNLVNSFQPAMVFIIGLLLTGIFPSIIKERSATKHLVHKFIAIAVIVAGSFLIYR